MKRMILILLAGAFVFISYLFFAEGTMQARAENAPVDEAYPKAVVQSPAFDFGKVLEGEVVTHAYVIANQGRESLAIKGVRTSCGCTTAQRPDTIAAGDQGRIVVKGNTRGYGGRGFNKTILVTTDDPANPQLTLKLTGQVEVFASVEPPNIILKGRKGEALQAEAIITPKKNYPFKLLAATPQGDLAQKIAVSFKQQNNAYRIVVRNVVKKAGSYRGYIRIKTDSDIRSELSLYVSGQIF